MKKFYFTKLDGLSSVTIRFRPTHHTIDMVDLDKDGRKKIKSLFKMTDREFIDYMRKERLSDGDRIYRTTRQLTSVGRGEEEAWYKGAWSYATKTLLEVERLPEIPEFDNYDKFLELWGEMIREEKEAERQKTNKVKNGKKALTRTKPIEKKVVVDEPLPLTRKPLKKKKVSVETQELPLTQRKNRLKRR